MIVSAPFREYQEISDTKSIVSWLEPTQFAHPPYIRNAVPSGKPYRRAQVKRSAKGVIQIRI